MKNEAVFVAASDMLMPCRCVKLKFMFMLT
jgi:hypothetical protein